ncbi:ParB N-terminal domain-containing protein [Candidatus Nitrotoga sp. M5]|uniref:ParB N-terminal domain-containing protein n=1 Tax=Candidatus Nitrotoga sp. M5 TaxID=2890409 RepID=UPI001EF16256|nr:ParB N-terminal domain-containing protein [Candidatus Nitrotoga sp. M5]
MLCTLPIQYIRVDRVRPNECHYPEHAAALAETILSEQLWRIPITLERNSLAVMDGHHRVEAARLLQLQYIPCLFLDYDQVTVSTSRQNYVVTPKEIVRRAKSGELYPPKTTRHQFPSLLPICNISLLLLRCNPYRKSKPVSSWKPPDSSVLAKLSESVLTRPQSPIEI